MSPEAKDELIQSAIEKMGNKIAPDVAKAGLNIARNIFEKGMLPKDALGMNANLVEGIYGHAYRLYNAGQFKESIHLFRLLSMLDPTQSKYMMGVAACHHMQKQYSEAAAAYALVGVIDAGNPIPHYHASDCFTKLKMIESAKIELQETINLCGTLPQYSMIRDRAEMTLEQLKLGNVPSSEAEPEATQSEEDEKYA